MGFNAPPVPGVGTRVGFEYQLLQTGSEDVRELARVSDEFLAKLRASGEATGISSNLNIALPQVDVELDRARAQAMGVPMRQLYGQTELLEAIAGLRAVERGRA